MGQHTEGRGRVREFAEKFYKSKAWQRCRDGYSQSVAGLCERCLAKGLYVPGTIVHHRVHLTPENIGNPSITLNWSNLELLCAEHHYEEHHKREKPRYTVDSYGRVMTR